MHCPLSHSIHAVVQQVTFSWGLRSPVLRAPGLPAQDQAPQAQGLSACISLFAEAHHNPLKEEVPEVEIQWKRNLKGIHQQLGGTA